MQNDEYFPLTGCLVLHPEKEAPRRKMEEETMFSNREKDYYGCKNFMVNEICEAFSKIRDNERTFHMHTDSDGNKQKYFGFVFLVHDDNTANKLALFRHSYTETNNQEDGTILIKIPNISCGISLTIRSHEDIEILNRYLRDAYDGRDRTFILCFPENDLLDRIQKSLDVLGRKYVFMDNKVLDCKLSVINETFGRFFYVDEAKKHIDAASTVNIVSNNLMPRRCISTGFVYLDKKLGYGGLRTGRLYALGGITSLGKTTLALNIADNIAKLRHDDVLIFSLEMSKYELVSKIHARNMNKLNRNMKNWTSKTATEIIDFDSGDTQATPWTDESIGLLNKAKEMYRQYAKHLMILECSDNFGVKSIRESLTKFHDLMCMPSVVIVDYLQILASESGRTDKQSVDKNILELKRLSRDFNIAMVIISSFNRSGYASDVDFKSFKESGSIEYSCDVVIGLQLKLGKAEKEAITPGCKENEEMKNNVDKKFSSNEKVIELCILKNRSYKSRGKVNLAYYAEYDDFIELPTDKQPPEQQNIPIAKWE
jgi:replicative DNA helicase